MRHVLGGESGWRIGFTRNRHRDTDVPLPRCVAGRVGTVPLSLAPVTREQNAPRNQTVQLVEIAQEGAREAYERRSKGHEVHLGLEVASRGERRRCGRAAIRCYG